MDGIKVIDMRKVSGDSAYLIDLGSHTILFDSGFGFTGHDVAKNIENYLGDRPLDYIFLTHSHYDHALGSAYILRHYPNAKVVAGTYATGIFKREGALRVMKQLDNTHAASYGITDYDFLGNELRVDIPVEDGDIIEVGGLSFEALNLPGHTRCSVAYYCKEKKLLLSSETLGVYDPNGNIIPSYLVSFSDSIKSIERVEKMDIEYLLAPHIGMLTKEQTAYFLKNMKAASEAFAQVIVDFVKAGKTDRDIIEDFKDKYWHGEARDFYPIAALELNTSIMIKLIKKELLGMES